MSNSIGTGGVHHMTLTVRDVKRSTEFYTRFLGFQVVVEFDPRVALSNGSLLLVLTPPPDLSQAVKDDRFNENRIGLDHVSLSVAGLAELMADDERARNLSAEALDRMRVNGAQRLALLIHSLA